MRRFYVFLSLVILLVCFMIQPVFGCNNGCDKDKDCKFCNGEHCVNHVCVNGTNPCTPPFVCREEGDQCVECISDSNCQPGLFCSGYQCKCDSNSCKDTQYCNGVETCVHSDNTYACKPGIAPCPNDGDYCNGVESCDEGTDKCKAGTNPCTDDRLFCNGIEGCNETDNACIHHSNPCAAGLSCDEETNQCIGCLEDKDCADDVYCNGAETCVNNICKPGIVPCPNDADFCNGTEVCNETAKRCESSGNPCTSPLICEEISKTCVNCVSDGNCDDNIYCNGVETCVDQKCRAGIAPCIDDGLFCNGKEGCNEDAKQCTNSGNPCRYTWAEVTAGTTGNDITPGCNEETDQCSQCIGDSDCNDGNPKTIDRCENGNCTHVGCITNTDCQDPIFCNGYERCENGTCVPGLPQCIGDGNFCNGIESCDEISHKCYSSGNPCKITGLGNSCGGKFACNNQHQMCVWYNGCEDELFCNGMEYCNDETGQCETTGNPCLGLLDRDDFCVSATCNELEQTCEELVMCPDDGNFCNGVETCNEELESCISEGDPCCEACGESIDSKCRTCMCDDKLQACVKKDPSPDDGIFCNGEEVCDEVLGNHSTGNPCTEGYICKEEEKQCAIPYGDVFPVYSMGDGKVDLLDYLEELVLVLGLEAPEPWQELRGDVPTGKYFFINEAKYCADPDGIMCLEDLQEIWDRALFGEIADELGFQYCSE